MPGSTPAGAATRRRTGRTVARSCNLYRAVRASEGADRNQPLDIGVIALGTLHLCIPPDQKLLELVVTRFAEELIDGHGR